MYVNKFSSININKQIPKIIYNKNLAIVCSI